MKTNLQPHRVAALFPEILGDDFTALKEDIRQNGLKVPILVHGGQILDGRSRYRACRELGIACPAVEWDGDNPWLELQSRNLLRRHLSKEQVYAIRKMAALQFPQLAAPIDAVRAVARARRAQAKARPLGQKDLIRSQDRYRESADAIGALCGVSGSTVKRVDRLAREAPELLGRVAAGELSAKRALRALANTSGEPLTIGGVMHALRIQIRAEFECWPNERREELLAALEAQLTVAIHQFSTCRVPVSACHLDPLPVPLSA